MIRTFDADSVNAILNHPDVLPFITIPSIDKIDATVLMGDPRNIVLMVDGGCFILIWHEPGIYEVHTNFLPSARGRAAIETAKEAARWMFFNTDCMTIVTQVPEFNKAAKWLCAKVGFELEFERRAVWPTADGLSNLSYWSLRYDHWIKKEVSLSELAKGIFPNSPDDTLCLMRIGAMISMIRDGQIDKAVILYNRFARFSGFPAINLIAKNPLMIDFCGSIIQIIDNSVFKVIKCR